MSKEEFTKALLELMDQAEKSGLKVCPYCNGLGEVRHPDSGVLMSCEACDEEGIEQ